MKTSVARQVGGRIWIKVPAGIASVMGLGELRDLYLCRERGVIRVYTAPREGCIKARTIVFQKTGELRYFAISIRLQDARELGIEAGREYAFMVSSFTLVPLGGVPGRERADIHESG